MAKKRNLLLSLKKKVLTLVAHSPTRFFYGLLGLLVLIIFLGNWLRQPAKNAPKEVVEPKAVEIFSIGEAPKVRLQAKVEKSGVIKIVALTGGVVNAVYKLEGQTVYQGETLAYLASNYNGASAPGVGRQIAQTNYNFVKDTYDTQKELIAKNREIIQKGNDQGEIIREITAKSIDETKSLISLNEGIINALDAQISELSAVDPLDPNILGKQQTKSGFLSGLNQARASLRSLEYQTNNENEPAEIANLQEEVALKQLEIQEKSLELNKEISRLNLWLSQIQESLSYPSAPCSGTIERVYVQEGQFVGPGTPIASLKADKTSLKLVALVSQGVAERVSPIEPSLLTLNDGRTVEIRPTYISTEPTDGGLFSLVYYPEESLPLKNAQYLPISGPMGQNDALSSVPFIPIDSVYQTNEVAYVYLAVDKKNYYQVNSRRVSLGEVYGDFVEVNSGLGSADKIVLDRSVIEGDKVKLTFE
jgi:multidrug efflux pump subunit AcrA (membrane-fusion protein)